MAVAVWVPGQLYQPGDLVRPTNSGQISQPQIDDPDFELGGTGWVTTGDGGVTYTGAAPVFSGAISAKRFGPSEDAQRSYTTNTARLAIVTGQEVTTSCYVQCTANPADCRAQIRLNWYDSGLLLIGYTAMAADLTIIGSGFQRITGGDLGGLVGLAADGVWVQISVTGIAPVNAAFWTPAISIVSTDENTNYAFDLFTASYTNLEPPNTLLFRAVQAAAGFSGNTEPDWPVTIGLTVVDNDVTWEAVSGNSVTWQASRILVSGAVEPVWPLTVTGSVADNTMQWTLDSRRIADVHVPTNSDVVIAASSKVFVADDDIVDYSATVNPLDWSTRDDAGFIPFGLQTFGANPVRAMGLYRGNLAIFNSEGCQLWQLDEDPAGITYLDAIPVSCVYPKSVQPVGDDLAFLSNLGIRSLGLSGAAINLQGGFFGQQIDPLVIAEIKAALLSGVTPRGLYWPAQGQYWLFFGAQAFVLTISAGPNEKKNRSWSRYTFPSAIDAWTIQGTDLVLRSGNLVWVVDPDAMLDDQETAASTFIVNLDPTLGAELYTATDYLEAVTTLELGVVQVHAVGFPVWLVGDSYTGSFAALSVLVGAEGATAVTVSQPVVAPTLPHLFVRYPADGPFTVEAGNTVGSTVLELGGSVGLTRYLKRFSAVRITRAGGVDWNFLAADVDTGARTITLEFPLEAAATAIRIFPVGSMRFNTDVSAQELFQFVALPLAGNPSGATTLVLTRALPALAVGLQAMVAPLQQTTAVGGSGTSHVDLNVATAFENSGASPEANFPGAAVLFAPFALLQSGGEFTGVMQWPFIDMKNPGIDKTMRGFDLTITGECAVSIGYNQRELEYDLDGSWTTPFVVDGDTLPDYQQPFEITGPSFSLRLEFSANQKWEWFAANLYVDDAS